MSGLEGIFLTGSAVGSGIRINRRKETTPYTPELIPVLLQLFSFDGRFCSDMLFLAGENYLLTGE